MQQSLEVGNIGLEEQKSFNVFSTEASSAVIARVTSHAEKTNYYYYYLRPTYPYQVPFCKNTRYGRDFVPYCISKKF